MSVATAGDQQGTCVVREGCQTTEPLNRMAAKSGIAGLDLWHILQLVLHFTAVPAAVVMIPK